MSVISKPAANTRSDGARNGSGGLSLNAIPPSVTGDASTILVVDTGGTNVEFGFVQNGKPRPYRHLFSLDTLCAGNSIEALAALVKEVVIASQGGGWALEPGHMPLCGEGCTFDDVRTDGLETYASEPALQGLAARSGETAERVFRAAGNAGLQDELVQFVRHQAFGVGAAVAMLSLATIVLGGGVPNIEGYPRDSLSQLIEAQAPVSETGRPLDLRWADHGWSSVLYGAPQVVADRWLISPLQIARV